MSTMLCVNILFSHFIFVLYLRHCMSQHLHPPVGLFHATRLPVRRVTELPGPGPPEPLRDPPEPLWALRTSFGTSRTPSGASGTFRALFGTARDPPNPLGILRPLRDLSCPLGTVRSLLRPP